MKETKIIMGMLITVEVVDAITRTEMKNVFDYFKSVDERFSTYKPASETSQINRGLPEAQWSRDMVLVMDLCEQTKQQTAGYFDIWHDGKLDPSGLVKGWAINIAADMLRYMGKHNFYIEAGGDIQAYGHNAKGQPWVTGIRNPFDTTQNVKVLHITDKGVATSGTYIRGQHIYNPHASVSVPLPIQSLTVVGPNIYEADRYATAAFAMGEKGIKFIEVTEGLEGYMIDEHGMATYTSGFERYVA